MGLEEKFNDALRDWESHIEKNSHYSTADRFINCSGYNKLVKLGPGILPYIENELDKLDLRKRDYGHRYSPGHFWGYVLGDIAGFKIKVGKKGSKSPVQKISEDVVGIRTVDVIKYMRNWLHKYAAKEHSKKARVFKQN